MGHPPVSQTGGIGPSRPLLEGPLELDVFLCHHRTPSLGTQGPCGVPYGGPLGLPPGRMDGGLVQRTEAIRGGSDNRTGGGAGLTRTLTATSDKDRGLAYSAAVHSQWGGTGGTGMA